MAKEKKPSQEVVVEGDYQSLTQKITLGPHQITADEPTDAGGDDRGPSPYELLLASLGACTSMTILLYAKRKGWEIRRVTVWLAHQKIYAQDCQDCETKDGYLDHIERRIHIDGNLDDEKRERLLNIANRCPVHQTLTHEIKIDTKLTERA